MGLARDSIPDSNCARGSARLPPPRPLGLLLESRAKVSSFVPVSAGVRPLGRQPKLFDRPRILVRNG
jgi:hypothetical protein